MQAAPALRLWLIGALTCVVAAVYWPSTVIFYEKWADAAAENYTHGWLILLICIALVVRSRRELTAAPLDRARFAPLALAAAILAWLVCYRASIEGLELPLVPVIFWLAVATAFGRAVGRLLLFPAAYFYFAVPVWYGTPLKDLTVLAMRGVLALTGPHAVFDGDVIHIPNGTFLIEEGCSGLHFMIVGLAIAALYGELQHDPWRIRARQLALMAVLAVLGNWVRVYTVIEAGYLTDMQSYLVRVSHYGFGWGVFAVALVLFFWLAPRLGGAAAVESAAPPPAGSATPRAELIGLARALAILAALPALSAAVRLLHPAAAAAEAPGVDPPPAWHVVRGAARSSWSPQFAGADQLRRQAFANGAGETIEVLGVAYRTQRQGAELVGETSSLLGDQLQPLAERTVSGASGVFRETEVADRTQARSLIWWRYEVAGRRLVRPFAQQLWYGINALVSNPPAGLIALRAACATDCSGARRTLGAFVATGGLP